ncbi:M36 family metallopeptidase [Actinoplanes sp. RD1]|uniref:M36 family metallopeptidase n=1 Tax=Actinoplanes sp. RD1 TaxID=3064538 RepID=UPI0027415191|nr:M36 family metallopeptidase [Actinoplanes sp. RD1]
MRFTTGWAAGASVVLLAGLLPTAAQAAPSPAAAVEPAAPGELHADNYDSRTAINAGKGDLGTTEAAKRVKAAEQAGSGARKLRDSLGVQGVVDIDRATGTPRRVARLDGFLTGPSRKKPEKIARDYLKAHTDVFGLSAAAVDALTLRQDYVDISGTHHLSFQQTVDGVAVFGNGIKAHVAKDGRLVQVDGSPIAALPASAGTAGITAEKARAAAVRDVKGDSAAKVTKRAADKVKTTTFTDNGTAKLVMFQTKTGPQLAWQVITVDEGYVSVVAAKSGEVLYRQSTVAEHSDSAGGLAWEYYPGAAVGGTQKKVDLSKWLPKGATTLSGSTGHVYADLNDDNAANAGEEIPSTGKGRFDYKFTDFTAQAGGLCSAQYQCSWDPQTPYSWQKNLGQNATQIFYYISKFHDHLKAGPIGFTRAAGNFEAADGDAVQAQALDGANTMNGLPDPDHTDNANMNTPPDGIAPIMQMYLWPDPSTPGEPFLAGNSGDEADIIYHEYTHGLSNRLVVDADGVSTLNSQQAGSMGEAWSDFYALDYLVTQGIEKDTKAVGDVKVGEYITGGDTIRYEAIDCPVGSTAAACAGGVASGPGGFTYGDLGKISTRGAEVHADGEIWVQTLWDLRQALGSSKTLSLVTRAMELSPADPSFLDQRNSILAADRVVNGGRNSAAIWKVFAKRGMGYFAATVDGNDVEPVEDFSLPPAANAPRGTLTGTVTDSATGAAVAGVTVGFGGHDSGFAGSYVATTAANGKYTISNIIQGTYPKVYAKGGGYDEQVATVKVGRAATQNWALRRDWAASSGGGSVVDFNGLDGNPYGCGTNQMIDQGQTTGWSSDGVRPGGGTTTAIEPRWMIAQLPAAVDVAELSINPSNICGDDASAATGDYRVETSADGSAWAVAAEGHFTPEQLQATTVPLAAGTGTGVKFIRYTMLGTQLADYGLDCSLGYSGCSWVDSAELSVYGTPAA